MKRIALPLLLAGTLLAQVANAQSSSTPVIGYYKVSVAANSSTALVCAFTNKKDFQGAASSISAAPNSVITVSGTPFSSLTLTSHYVEILSGPQAGLVVDIVGQTNSSVTVDTDLTAAGLVGTETFCVRKHTTLNDVFRSGADLAPFADSVMVVSPSGEEKLYGSDGSQVVDASDFVTPAGDDIVYPGQGFVVSSAGGGTYTFGGNATSYIHTGPLILPAYEGRLNLLGVMNPVVDDSLDTPAAANEVTQLSGLGLNTLTPFADTVSIFSVDGLLNEFLIGSDGAAFVDAADFVTPVPGTTPVRNGAAVSISVAADAAFTQPQLVP